MVESSARNEKELYPYGRTGMDDLPDENWRDIIGFEDYYQVSNLGRVKSMDRVVSHPRREFQKVAGRMLKQSIARNRNIKTGEPTIDLRVSLSKGGKMYYYNTRRLVYLAFVDGSISYAKDKLCIINRDGNGFNNSVENLISASNSAKGKRVFERGRLDSYLKSADRSKWMKPYGGFYNRRAIEQYDSYGNKIASFESIAAAVQATGFDEKEIIRTAKKKRNNYKGFVWQYVAPERL